MGTVSVLFLVLVTLSLLSSLPFPGGNRATDHDARHDPDAARACCCVDV